MSAPSTWSLEAIRKHAIARAAAGRQQPLIDTRAGQPDIADMWVKMNREIEAVRSSVPESMWPEIVRKLDGWRSEPRRSMVRSKPRTTMRRPTRWNLPSLTTTTTCDQSRVRQRAHEFSPPGAALCDAIWARGRRTGRASQSRIIPNELQTSEVSFVDSQSLTASWPIW
jgi:hypothetical protein